METLQKVARAHGFCCLLHEKPFAGVNGSGKHNNWSIGTDDGINLLNPGESPHENTLFLAFLFAVIRAVDKYAKLLRASVASPGNEHRLGANEAPPAIVSIFLGDQLTDIFAQIESGGASNSKNGGTLRLGVNALPPLAKDCTDRNRTSPFAFTGNKFEFRMVGSSQSTSGPNFVLNTIVAETLSEMADELEGAKKGADKIKCLQDILQKYARAHKRIIFNGDNYSDAWHKEAEKRGLPNIRNCVDSLASITEKGNETLFEKHGVLTKSELHARTEILLENYAKSIHIEGRTSLQMAKRQIFPAAAEYAGSLATATVAMETAGAASKGMKRQTKELQTLVDSLDGAMTALEKAIEKASGIADAHKKAVAYRDLVVPAMTAVRTAADKLESIVGAETWPIPTYAEMLFDR
jgi:glutamine synthetase